jgi:uncharacterized Zn-binding protein involved in type VI secretion
MASAVEGISNVMNTFMLRPQMTPVDATASLVQISQTLVQGAATAVANGAPAAAATAATAVVAMNAANVALTTVWTAASVVPGGQPAANIAYTEGIKIAAAAAASAVVASMASLSDMDICPILVPIPPHGPGFVTRGSSTVKIGNLPAARMGDQVYEACGGANPIVAGCMTVMIGDSGSGGSGGGSGSGGAGAGAGGAGGAGGGGAAAAPSNGPFATQDEAARAALERANPDSIRDNREYAGLIYRGADGQYYYTGPVQGTDQGANPSDAPAPAGSTVVGDYHTHGDYSTADPVTGDAVRTSDPARDDFNSDNFSGVDRAGIASDGAGTPGYAGYLGTPSGTFRRYDPATGSDTVL